MRNKLLKKFLSFSYGSFIGAAISFLTTMFTTRLLAPEEFGKVSMFTLFINLAMILAIFGTDQAFVRFFYEEFDNKRGALLYNCLKVAFFILIPVILTFFIIRTNLLQYLFSEYESITFYFLCIAVVTKVAYRYGTLVVRMQQKGNMYSLLEILNKLFLLIGVVVFYTILGETYKIIIYSTVISSIVLLIFLIYSQKEFWSLSNIKVKNTIHSKKNILTFSYPLAFTIAVMWVFEGFDKFAIRTWSNFNELGLYAAAFKIISLIAILKVAFSTFWTPVAYERYQNNPDDTKFYTQISKLVSFLMILVGLLIIMLKDVLIMLLGGGYEKSSLMLSFLVLIPIMYTISETTVIGINFKKKVKWHVVIAGVSCICNIFGNWLLVPQYGGIGAAVSTGVCYIIFFTLRTIISTWYYKVNYALAKVYTSTLVLVSYACYTLLTFQPINEQVIGVIAITIVTIIYIKDLKEFVKSISIFSSAI